MAGGKESFWSQVWGLLLKFRSLIFNLLSENKIYYLIIISSQALGISVGVEHQLSGLRLSSSQATLPWSQYGLCPS